MIVSITLNPAIDKSTTIGKIKPASKLRCTTVVREPGGGGINVSKALLRLGLPSLNLVPAGGHNGNMLCSLLENEKLKYERFDTPVETRENWMVVEKESNDQFRFTFPGADIEKEILEKIFVRLRELKPSIIIASGSLPPGLPADSYALVIREGKKLGAEVIIDSSGEPLKQLKGQGAWMIKPNLGELATLTGIQHLEREDIVPGARKLIEQGYASLIAVSMGGDGAWLVTREEDSYSPVPKVEQKSTVGAGDSMVGGLIYAYSQKFSLEDASMFAVACGTAATMNEGTQLFNKADAFELFEKLKSNKDNR